MRKLYFFPLKVWASEIQVLPPVHHNPAAELSRTFKAKLTGHRMRFLTLPCVTPISTSSRKSKSQDIIFSGGDLLGDVPPSRSVCAPYPMTRSQTPLWGKSRVSERLRSNTHWCCAPRARNFNGFQKKNNQKKNLRAQKGDGRAEKYIQRRCAFFFFSQSYKTSVTVYGTRGGCIALRQRGCCTKSCLRSLLLWKLHLLSLQMWIDVSLMANSCSG